MSNSIQQLAEQVTLLLGAEQWGIGGSFLLYCHGLVDQAQDLDLVCSPEFFPHARERLLQLGREVPVPPHPVYCSQNFFRVQTQWGIVELMAGIQVRQHEQLLQFQFQPERLQWQAALPLMALQDWLYLYQLFNRPTRVKMIEDFLLRQSVG